MFLTAKIIRKKPNIKTLETFQAKLPYSFAYYTQKDTSEKRVAELS